MNVLIIVSFSLTVSLSPFDIPQRVYHATV